MERLDSQISFLLEADRLKTVIRQTVITDLSRQENSAEHSWHLALMALVLAEHAPAGTDLGRVMGMLVLHDLVEIDAGDLFLYADPVAQAQQAEAEHAAAERIFAILPPGQAGVLRGLWEEFEKRQSQEAKFARALDRLQPMLMNMVCHGGTWVAHGITLEQVLPRVALIEDGSAVLGEYARQMLATAVERGFLAPAGAAPRQPIPPAGPIPPGDPSPPGTAASTRPPPGPLPTAQPPPTTPTPTRPPRLGPYRDSRRG